MKNDLINKNELIVQSADYITGKMTDSERMQFEHSLEQFPELKSQLVQEKALFDGIDSGFMQENIDRRTRNLSVKVNAKLNAKSSISDILLGKYSLSAGSMLALFILVFAIFNTGSQNDNLFIDKDISELVNSLNNDSLFTDSDIYLITYQPIMQDGMTENNEILFSQIDELLADNLDDAIAINDDDVSNLNESELIDLINNTDNKDFQSILKELNDVKINP
jgi:hypothetical protein